MWGETAAWISCVTEIVAAHDIQHKRHAAFIVPSKYHSTPMLKPEQGQKVMVAYFG